MSESISIQMSKILDAYSDEVRTAANEAIQSVSKECVKKLRNSSPRKTGSYAKGWRVKKVKSRGGVVDYVVHNATNGELTHLLENGHVVRNKKGTYGRAPAHPHIKPVEEWANMELPAKIERELT